MSSIFREYDIRGRVPAELDEGIAERLGAAFARFLAEKGERGPVLAGCDARLSSEALLRAFERGVMAEGRDVLDSGLVTTPLFYFSVIEADAAGGAMITASHNPAEWNGAKLTGRRSEPLYKESGLLRVEELSRESVTAAKREGSIEAVDFSERYMDFLVIQAKGIGEGRRPLRVVADASNGSAGFLLERLFRRLARQNFAEQNMGGQGIEAEKLFFKPDGRFPNHPPDPLQQESHTAARDAILRTHADLGCVLDADGDRIIFLDETGHVILGTTLFAFLLDRLAMRGESAVSTVFGSRIIRDIAAANGVDVKMVPVGSPYVKTAMRASGARLGGELSGHYYFREFHGFDSALLTLVRVMDIVSQSEQLFSELFRPYEKYFHSGELSFEADVTAIEQLREKYADGRPSFLDGLTVEYDDWWFCARPSKTEPLLRLVVEANERGRLEEKIQELGAAIRGH